MPQLDALTAEVRLDLAKFNAGLAQIKRQFAELNKSFGTLGGGGTDQIATSVAKSTAAASRAMQKAAKEQAAVAKAAAKEQADLAKRTLQLAADEQRRYNRGVTAMAKESSAEQTRLQKDAGRGLLGIRKEIDTAEKQFDSARASRLKQVNAEGLRALRLSADENQRVNTANIARAKEFFTLQSTAAKESAATGVRALRLWANENQTVYKGMIGRAKEFFAVQGQTRATTKPLDFIKAFPGSQLQGFAQGFGPIKAQTGGSINSLQTFGATSKKVMGEYNNQLTNAQQNTRKMAAASKEAAGGVDKLGSALGRIAVFSIGAGVIVRSFFALEQALTGMVAEGLRFNATLEQSVVSLAGILGTTRDVVNAQGKVVDQATALPFLLQQAAVQQRAVLLADAETLGTGEELLGVYEQVLALTGGQVATDKQRLQVAELITTVGKTARLNGQQLTEEARQLFTLESKRGQDVLRRLGISIKEARLMQQQGTYVSFLLEKGKAYDAIIDSIRNSWEGLTSTAKTFVSLTTGQAFAPLFAGLEQVLRGFNAEMERIEKQGGLAVALGLTPEQLQKIGRDLADITLQLTHLTAQAVGAFANFIGFVGVENIFKALDLAVQTLALVGIVKLITGVNLLTASIATLNAVIALNPWLIWATIIAAVGVGAYALYKQFTATNQTLNEGALALANYNKELQDLSRLQFTAGFSQEALRKSLFPALTDLHFRPKPLADLGDNKAAKELARVKELAEEAEARLAEARARITGDAQAALAVQLQAIDAETQRRIVASSGAQAAIAQIERAGNARRALAQLDSVELFIRTEKEKTDRIIDQIQRRNQIERDFSTAQRTLRESQLADAELELQILQDWNRPLTEQIAGLQEVTRLRQQLAQEGIIQTEKEIARQQELLALYQAQLLKNQELADQSRQTGNDAATMLRDIEAAAAGIKVSEVTGDIQKLQAQLRALRAEMGRIGKAGQNEIEKISTAVVHVGDAIAESIGKALEDMADGTFKLEDAIKDLSKSIQREFIRAFVEALKEKLKFDVKIALNTKQIAGQFAEAGQSIPDSMGGGLQQAGGMLDSFVGTVKGGISKIGGFIKGLGNIGAGMLGNMLGGGVSGLFGLGQSAEGQMGGQIGSLIGGIAGSFLGGPIGSFIGSFLGRIAGSFLGGLFAPGRIAAEKKNIEQFFEKVFEGVNFKTFAQHSVAEGLLNFKDLQPALLALGTKFAQTAKGATQGTVIRFAGQFAANLTEMGASSDEARSKILKLAQSMSLDLASGIEAINASVSKNILSLSTFTEEMADARKNLSQYGNTANLTAKQLSDLALANGNTGSYILTVNAALAGVIAVGTEFTPFIDSMALANQFLSDTFIASAKATGYFNDSVLTIANSVRDGNRSIEEGVLALNDLRAAAGLAALDLNSFRIDPGSLQRQIELILAVVRELASGINSAIMDGLTSGLKAGDVAKAFRATIYTALVKTIVEGFVQGFIKAATATGPLTQALGKMSKLIQDFVSGSIGENEFLKGVTGALGEAKPLIERIAEAVGIASDKFRDILASLGILPDIMGETAGNAKSLADELRKAAHDLLMDQNLTPLKPKERETQAFLDFQRLREKALAGDAEAAKMLPEAGRQLLEQARLIFGSSLQYENIFNLVRQTLLQVADKFGGPADVQDRQLLTLQEIRDLLRKLAAAQGLQHGGIITRPTFALMGERGPEAVIPLTGHSPLSLPIPMGGRAAGYDSPGLLQEVRALRAEVAGLRSGDGDGQPIQIQVSGDVHLGREKMGQFISEVVQFRLSRGDIRVPNKTITRERF